MYTFMQVYGICVHLLVCRIFVHRLLQETVLALLQRVLPSVIQDYTVQDQAMWQIQVCELRLVRRHTNITHTHTHTQSCT